MKHAKPGQCTAIDGQGRRCLLVTAHATPHAADRAWAWTAGDPPQTLTITLPPTATWKRSMRSWHRADDPHCTCNDCIAHHAAHLEAKP